LKIIKSTEPKNCLNSNKFKNIKIFAKNPADGGIPEIEKKIKTNDKALSLFTLESPAKFEIKKRG